MAPMVGVFPLCPFPSVSICSQAQCFPGAALPLPANWPLDAGSTDFSSQNQPSHLYSTLPFFFLKKMLAAPSGMWDPSSPTRDQTHVPCIGRWILNPWTTRKVLTFFSIPCISFLRRLTFFICFKYVHNISITSVLALVDCLFFRKFEIFLVLGTMRNILLKPGHFVFYVIRSYLLKSSALAGFL